MVPNSPLKNLNDTKLPSTSRSIFIWSVGNIYFILSVLVAILFGMLAPNLQARLHLNEAQIGVLGSSFFLCYGLAQLIGGRLMDSWGPRLTLTVSALITSLGLFVFSKATSFTQVLIAQIFSGIGLSTSYIGAIFLASTWFLPSRFALVSGITQMSADLVAALAIVGIVFSGALLLGFEVIMSGFTIIMFCTTLLILLVVRESPLDKQTPENFKPLTFWSAIKKLINISQFWLGTLYFSTAFSVLLAFSNLWNIPDQLVYGHSLQTASIMTSMLPLGGAFGSAVSGWLAGLTKRGSLVAMLYSFGMFIVCVFLIYGWFFSTSFTSFLLILLGFFFGGAVLGFPLVSQHIPATLKGTGFGLMATIAYLLSAFLQYLVGVLLGGNISLQHNANPHDFKVALCPLVITLAIGSIASLWLRDKGNASFKEI